MCGIHLSAFKETDAIIGKFSPHHVLHMHQLTQGTLEFTYICKNAAIMETCENEEFIVEHLAKQGTSLGLHPLTSVQSGMFKQSFTSLFVSTPAGSQGTC